MRSTLKIVLCAICALPLGAAADEPPPHNPDPWESVNRKIFVFNDTADRYLLRPLAKGYEKVTPQFLQDGIHNMFANLGEVGNTANALLQAKFAVGAGSGGRFLLNSTVGVLGFFDVAGRIGLPAHSEDFGQTLGYWGVTPGPYLVVPLFGPRTVRDGLGSIADSYTDPVTQGIDYVPTRNQLIGVRVVDGRAQLLQAEQLMSGDRYIFIRDAYLQRRQFLVNDGVVDDTFGDGDQDFDMDEGEPGGDAAPGDAAPGSSP